MHFDTSRSLSTLAAELFSRGQDIAAGELVWGAIVHAVSAADPTTKSNLQTGLATPTKRPILMSLSPALSAASEKGPCQKTKSPFA